MSMSNLGQFHEKNDIFVNNPLIKIRISKYFSTYKCD